MPTHIKKKKQKKVYKTEKMLAHKKKKNSKSFHKKKMPHVLGNKEKKTKCL